MERGKDSVTPERNLIIAKRNRVTKIADESVIEKNGLRWRNIKVFSKWSRMRVDNTSLQPIDGENQDVPSNYKEKVQVVANPHTM